MKMARRAASDEIFGSNLADFFSNSNVGLAVFDDKLRYQAINPWLAQVHRYSVDFHIGKTVHAILGEVASLAEPAIRRVLATGLPVSHLQIEGRLPTKMLAERWVDSFFPIKNHRGDVHQVGAVVLSIPTAGIAEENSLTTGTVLRSWKEIASYVGACTKTVQRWEQTHRFPVRRVQAGKGAVVFAIRDEVDNWLSQDARTAPAGKTSWGNFINSPLPTLILDDERIILDANVSISLIGRGRDDLIGKKLEAFKCDPNTTASEREWALFREAGASVGLHNFCRLDGTVFAAEYTLRTMQPGVRILTVTAVREEPVSEETSFHQAGPKRLP
jgi:predicted DNA-binding transcriptional regulator AlpA